MRYLLLLLLLCFQSIAYAGDPEKILKVLKDQQEAWNKGNLPAFMEGYWNSDSLRFVSKKGVTKGWKASLKNYEKSYPTVREMGRLHFSDIEIDFLNEHHALVVGKWQLYRSAGELGGYFTLHFKLIGAQWKIVLDHTS